VGKSEFGIATDPEKVGCVCLFQLLLSASNSFLDNPQVFLMKLLYFRKVKARQQIFLLVELPEMFLSSQRVN
jgi:hypothetical protein